LIRPAPGPAALGSLPPPWACGFYSPTIEEDMSQTEQIDPLELESKDYWLRRFRKAKSMKTLELMVPKAVDQYHKQAPVLAAIYLAECQRERELEYGVLLNR
jgi:hypothetical protein